jgi:hypothetical protein
MPDVPLPNIPVKLRLVSEFRLVVACTWIAPPAMELDQAEKIASLCREKIDWDLFVVLVRRHAVAALSYKLLCRHAASLLPENVRALLKDMSIQCSAHALKQAAELRRLIRTFSDQGVELIPLKGVFLAHQLYGEPGLRQAGDIDILVHPDHLEKACQIFEAEGYNTTDTGGFQWTDKQRRSIRENLHHFVFESAPKALSIELHWKIKFWSPGQMAEILRHTARIDFYGLSVLTLNSDALLLTLSDHGAKHLWFELKWLGDVVRLLSQDRDDGWGDLIELAERLDLTRTLAHAALLAHWIYGIPLADELMRLVRDNRSAVRLSIPALNYMKSYIDKPASRRIPMDNFWAAYHVRKSRPSTPFLFFLKPLFTSPADYQRFPLPDSLFWLYIPLRPVFWFIRNYSSIKK